MQLVDLQIPALKVGLAARVFKSPGLQPHKGLAPSLYLQIAAGMTIT